MDTKACSTCDTVKPVSEFYKDKRRSDGLYAHCKTCHYAFTQAYRQTDAGKMAQQRYAQSDAGKLADERKRKQYNQSEHGRVANRLRSRRNSLAYYYSHRGSDKHKARWTITNDVQNGRLMPARQFACTVCGNAAQDYHHHKGYEREYWRDVVPVCRKCHSSITRSEKS